MQTQHDNPIVTSGIQTIGPGLALKHLATMVRNRKAKANRVETYARDMREGRWQFTASPIVFDDEGRLIDGQHRLAAILKSGTSQRFVVTTGLDPESQMVMDNGARRTAGDQLQLHGHKLAATQASAAWTILRFEQMSDEDRQMPYPFFYQPTVTEVVEFVEKNPDLLRSAEIARKAHNVIAPGKGAAFHFMFYKKHQEKADEFFEKLATGLNLQADDPAYILRERLTRGVLVDPITQMAFVIKAWNSYRQEEKVKQLRWANNQAKHEGFPKIF